MEIAAGKLKNGKAPGIDGIPSEAVNVMVEAVGERVLRVMNCLYEDASFPIMWKKSKLV